MAVKRGLGLFLVAFAFVLSIGAFFTASSANAACAMPNSISNGQVADATAVMGNFNALKACVDSAVSTTNNPTAGSLSIFSSGTTITAGDLSGDCTTSGTVAVTCTKSNGTPLGAFATGTDASNLTGTISVNRFNNGLDADATHFLRGDGSWATPSGNTGSGGGIQTVLDSGYLKSVSASDGTFIPNGSNNTPSTSASNPGNLKVTFTVTDTQILVVDLFAILSRTSGLSRAAIYDTAGNRVWPKYPQSPDAADPWTYHSTAYSRWQGEGDGQILQFTAAIPVSPGTYTWVVRADHAVDVGTVTWYDRMLRVQYR